MPRFLIILALASASALAQETPQTTPEPAAPAGSTEPAAPASSPDAAPSPSPAASPAPDATPGSLLAPEELPAPSANEGAPLLTEDIIPMDPGTSVPDEAFVDPNAIVPDEPPAPPSPISIESETEKRREQTIRYRELRVKAEQEPAIAAMKAKADSARSPEDQRAALREYYRMLFARIIKLDKSLEEKCKTLEDAYLRRLAQTRLEPTIPLNPPPTPEPLN